MTQTMTAGTVKKGKSLTQLINVKSLIYHMMTWCGTNNHGFHAVLKAAFGTDNTDNGERLDFVCSS